MQERTLPKLLVGREEAFQQIRGQIEKGEKLREQSISSEDQLGEVGAESSKWSRYNTDLLVKLFDASTLADEYKDFFITTLLIVMRWTISILNTTVANVHRLSRV